MYAVTCSTDLTTSHLHINFSITFLVIIHLYKLIHAMWSAYFIDRVKKALYNINRIVYRSWWFFLNNVPIMYHHLTVWCHQRSSRTPNIKGQWGWSTQSWSWKHGGTVLHTVNSDLFVRAENSQGLDFTWSGNFRQIIPATGALWNWTDSLHCRMRLFSSPDRNW